MKDIKFDIDTHIAVEWILSNIDGDENRVRVCQELAVLAPLLWDSQKRPIINLTKNTSL